MRTLPSTLATAGVVAATTLLAGPTTAHADLAGGGLTLQGSTFATGQTYTVTIDAPVNTTDPLYLVDAYSYVLYEVSGTAGPGGTTTFNWAPTNPGTHQLSVQPWSTLDYGGEEFPTLPTPPYGPVTVQVSGSGGTDPTTCTTPAVTGTACMTMHGTPEVGCPLTFNFTYNGTPPSDPQTAFMDSASAAVGSASGGGAELYVGQGAYLAQQPTARALATPDPRTVKWTPNIPDYLGVSGFYDFQEPSVPFSPTPGVGTGGFVVHAAPAGPACS